MFTNTVPAESDTAYWSTHNVPSDIAFYLNSWTLTPTPVAPTFVQREWDRTRWNYIHPETGETLRTVFTYF